MRPPRRNRRCSHKGALREASHEDAIVRTAGRPRSDDATIHKEFRLPLRRLTFDVLERQGRRCGKTPCRRADGCDPFRASRCGASNRIRPDRAGTASRSGRPKAERARAPRGHPGSSRRTEIRRTKTRGPGERIRARGLTLPVAVRTNGADSRADPHAQGVFFSPSVSLRYCASSRDLIGERMRFANGSSLNGRHLRRTHSEKSDSVRD